jgi:DNA end-binding protein Ku
MPRSIWSGSIAFGLVNIPVSLTNAESRPDVQLHMVDSKNHARIRYERVNSESGEEVPWDRMVRGYEYEDGQFILLTDKDLEAVQPKLTKTIEITEFVPLADIDPLLFDKPYYLEPDKRGQKAYALLREALRISGKAGIAKVVIRTREYLSAMFPRGDALVLMLLRFPQEIRNLAKLELPSAEAKEWQPAKRELDLALRLIDEMSGKWVPDEHHDEYRQALLDFIERKVAQGDVATDVKGGDERESAAVSTKVVDLAEYLQRSVEQAGGGKRKPAAKKTAKKKATKHAAKATSQKARKRA